MTNRFENKVAIVTGAGQGIGEAYAKRLASEGAAVVIAELNIDNATRVAHEIAAAGGQAIAIRTDVSDEASCAAMAVGAAEAFGGIDLLVNNAAIFAGLKYQSLMDIDYEYYQAVMAVNADGGLLVSRAVVPFMEKRGGGAIVNQSSTAAYTITPGGGHYGISKLATNGLTMALSQELGPKGIRVNGVAPGPTNTEAMAQVPKEKIDAIMAQLPIGRLGEVDDIANAVLFLLSDEASWITGQTLCVDGGMIRKP